jgi:hypothetical protein
MASSLLRARWGRCQLLTARAMSTTATTKNVFCDTSANGVLHLHLNRPEALNALDEGEGALHFALPPSFAHYGC